MQIGVKVRCHPLWVRLSFGRSLQGVLSTPLCLAGNKSTKVNQPLAYTNTSEVVQFSKDSEGFLVFLVANFFWFTFEEKNMFCVLFSKVNKKNFATEKL